VRNNLCVAGLTDENDMMMTIMGAEEVRSSLVDILEKLDANEEDNGEELVKNLLIENSKYKESESLPELDELLAQNLAERKELDELIMDE